MPKNLASKYAIIEIKGRQYRVSEGEELIIDRTNSKDLKVNMLLYRDGAKVKIGKPYLTGINLKFKILGEEKGEKINVFKYKAKSRYRKKIGFRPIFTKLLIEKISL